MIRLAALAAMALVLGGCDGEFCADASGNNCQAARDAERLQANREKMASHFSGSDLNPVTTTMNVYRDPVNGVTCWSQMGYPQSLSCIPNWMLTAPKGGMAVRP